MTQQIPEVETTLRVTKTIAAPRDRVFKAWTEPEMLKQWMGPEASFTVPIAEVDLRVGGTYRLGMLPPGESEPHVVGGVYREVRPPEKLVFTWKWEQPDGNVPDPAADSPEMVVTVEFRDMGGSTEVVVTHEYHPDKHSRDEHAKGWNGCLEQLAALMDKAGS